MQEQILLSCTPLPLTCRPSEERLLFINDSYFSQGPEGRDYYKLIFVLLA